jgi:ribosomal protein S19
MRSSTRIFLQGLFFPKDCKPHPSFSLKYSALRLLGTNTIGLSKINPSALWETRIQEVWKITFVRRLTQKNIIRKNHKKTEGGWIVVALVKMEERVLGIVPRMISHSFFIEIGQDFFDKELMIEYFL